MSKYSKEIAQALRNVQKPFPQLKISVLEYPDFLQVNVFENQIMGLSDEQRGAVFDYLIICRDMVQSYGVKCELGGLTGDPR